MRCRIRLKDAALLLSCVLFGFDPGPDVANKPFCFGVHRSRCFNEFHERMQPRFGIPVGTLSVLSTKVRVSGPDHTCTRFGFAALSHMPPLF